MAHEAKETDTYISQTKPRLTFLLIEARLQGIFGGGLVFLSGSVDPDVQSLEKPEGLPEHSPGFPTLGLGSYNHHEP